MSSESHIRQLNEEYIAAFMKADVGWYEAHLADDFTCVESDGSVLRKEAFLRQAARGPDVAAYQLVTVQVRIYGDVALVQATGSFSRGDGSTGISRYLDVYVREADAWKVVYAQITRAPK
jgi:ketosteroid isomerase-like protein